MVGFWDIYQHPSKENTLLNKRMRIVLTAAVAAMALSAVLASTAAAAIVPANFSSTSIKLTTSNLTVRANGAEPKLCSAATLSGTAENNNFYVGNSGGFAESKFTCGGAQFTMVFLGEARYDTVAGKYIFHVNDFPSWSLWSPWGSYSQNVAADGTWVNGSGSTASTATFSGQTVGYTTGGKKVSIEGTFKATTSSGGLLTLSH